MKTQNQQQNTIYIRSRTHIIHAMLHKLRIHNLFADKKSLYFLSQCEKADTTFSALYLTRFGNEKQNKMKAKK